MSSGGLVMDKPTTQIKFPSIKTEMEFCDSHLQLNQSSVSIFFFVQMFYSYGDALGWIKIRRTVKVKGRGKKLGEKEIIRKCFFNC